MLLSSSDRQAPPCLIGGDSWEMFEMSWGLERGRIYNRRADIHARFNGQQRGGIVTPSGANVIFIFTGETGESHGYSDRWRPDGVFEYFGEGQVGDMQMQKGNRAVAEHAKNGKSTLLFKIGLQGVKFADDVVCEGYEVRKALGRLGNIRDAFVFHLRPMDNLNERVDAQQVSALDMGALLEMAFSAANPPPKKTTILSQVVERSRAVRDYGSPAPMVTAKDAVPLFPSLAPTEYPTWNRITFGDCPMEARMIPALSSLFARTAIGGCTLAAMAIPTTLASLLR